MSASLGTLLMDTKLNVDDTVTVSSVVGTLLGSGEGSRVGDGVGCSVGGLVAMVMLTEPVVTFTPRTLPTLLEKVGSAMLVETVDAADVLKRRSPSMYVEPISKLVIHVVIPLLLTGFEVAEYFFTCLESTPMAVAR